MLMRLIKAIKNFRNINKIRKSCLVDADWYTERYGPLKGLSPEKHYYINGWREGCDPNKLFDTKWFSKENNLDDEICPLIFYIENWKVSYLNPSELFDAENYLLENKDVLFSKLDPLFHYLEYGEKEGRKIKKGVSNNWLEKLSKKKEPIIYFDHVSVDEISGWVSCSNLKKNQKIEFVSEGEVFLDAIANIQHKSLEKYFDGRALGFEIKGRRKNLDPFLYSMFHVRDYETKALFKCVSPSNLKVLSFYDYGVFFDEDFYNLKYKGCWGWEHYCSFGFLENRVPAKNLVPEAIDKFFSNNEIGCIPLINMVNYLKSQEGRGVSDSPVLSIVILNWNKSLMTLQCVATIFKNSYHKDIEIVVVDNGSEDNDYKNLIYLKAFPCVKVIRNKTNRYYGEANNIGVEITRSKNICLLNNDAFVYKSWDRYLLEELDSSPDIGGVGPKFLFPDGKLQEAGGQLNPCGNNIQIGKFMNPESAVFNKKADVTHISAACFILTREVFDRVNGFDYRYEPAYFEDADLTAKIKSLGYKIRYVPGSEVMHVENATSKEPNIGFDFGSLIGTNRVKFVEKWGEYLRGGAAPITPDFRKSYGLIDDGGKSDKVAVIYSPYNLIPGGGERYVLNLAVVAKENGYKTYFCSPEKYSKYRFHTVAYELGIDVSGIHLIEEEGLTKKNDISLFIVMSNELSPSMKAKGKDKNIYHCQFPFPMSDWHLTNCLNNVIDYDVIIVNSEFTKQSYENEAKKYYLDIPPVKVVSPPVDMIERKGKPNDGVVRVLNVGRFISGGHCKKQVELVQAFNILTKELAEKNIETKMTLIGSLGPSQEDREYLEKIKAISGNNVEIILNASRETIIEHYQQSNFYWHGTGINEDVINNPQVFEHFGITPVEAMSAGCVPVVWHEGGPKEILDNLTNNSYSFLAYTENEYVIKTIDLIGSEFNVDSSVFSEFNFKEKLRGEIL